MVYERRSGHLEVICCVGGVWTGQGDFISPSLEVLGGCPKESW